MLNMSNISKSFGSNRVLSEVDFHLDGAEIVALLGANGAGKSTLMKIMTGVYSKDSGDISIDGQIVSIGTPSDAMKHGVRLVPQELQVLPDLTVAENIFLGSLPTSSVGPVTTVDKVKMHDEARRILAELGLDTINVKKRLSNYSVSEQRLVEIARALAGEAKILVMDEPTASLSEPECKRLFEILRQLKERGVSVILISHFLDEVFQICDRIEVLRDGKNVGSFVTKNTDHHEVLTSMLGRELDDLFPHHCASPGDIVFSADRIRHYPNVQNVSFSVRAGEIHGIFGLIGSGVEEVGKLTFGTLELDSGVLQLEEQDYAPHSTQQAIAHGVGFVSGERKSEGIVGVMPVRDNITFPYLERHKRGVTLSTKSQNEVASKWIDNLGVITSGPGQLISGLSGGNQQKICIGRWLVDDLKLLILEEPTRGVDLGARRDIYTHLRALADDGLAIVIISSDAEEIAGLADTSTVLIDGTSTDSFSEPTDATTLMAAGMRDTNEQRESA